MRQVSIIADDPITAPTFAVNNDLLSLPGWKRLTRIVRNQKKLERMTNQSKLRSVRRAPIYKLGVQVPRNSREARLLDPKYQYKWTAAEGVELAQLHEYNTFKNLGKCAKVPEGYQRIRVHFVYDVKHDLRFKARLVADGNLTQPGKDESYSGVVSLKTMRMALLIGELNGLT